MIDCHTHLGDASFDADREAVVARAQHAGVRAMALMGQDAAENETVLALCGGRPEFLAFLGLHPDRFADRAPAPEPAEVDAVAAMIEAHAGRITGIGEVGLDYWVCADEARREAQRDTLRRWVALANTHDLPLNVHSRSAGHYTIDLLLEAGARRVLMHAFDGKAGHAMRAAEAGFVFSIPPSIVRSPQKQKLARALPMHALALETDSPVLGPEKGVRNEPANLPLVVGALAEIKGLAPQAIMEQTTATATALFRLNGAD